ncbi:hypothetical protein [Xylanibacter ruminicola]|uniref:Uncharacterized protein n=1 Tax=Xylanibacter ruminicola TaxID=839 RepID=A0A1M6T6A9_XYLRU|nr:hypothetical protein [Xylanibacter ruminicola]SHK52507.1 hypothetical protein SAMN05216463_10535 [Xylanibacter ruminicola]
MGFWNKLFGNKDEQKVGGMEDFMTLIRVYFQAAMAADLGITNLAALPDLRVFKTTLKVATVNNKLGVGERSRCKNMLKSMYGMNDEFFKEIDGSLRKRCKKVQDAQTYLLQFQGFTQEIMMLTGNLMKFKLRLPGFMKKAIYTMTEKTVNDIFNKNDFTDTAVLKSVVAVREYNRRLGFSQKWITDFVFKVVMLAKKEPKPAQDEK